MFMNRVTLVGFAGAAAKNVATPGGHQITRFSIATSKRYKSGNEWKDSTQWHNCVVYNVSVKAAETIQKGDHLLIEGELSYREYDRTVETDSGPVKVKWPVAEIIVHSIAPLDRQTMQGDAG
jgi:single-strand DNA-binding protein